MKNKLHYIVIPSIVLAVSYIGSLFTRSGMDGWYQSLSLPSWTPDGSLIGLAWTIIFILTAIALIIFWNKREEYENKNLIINLFVLNGFLNLFWSFLFFNQHLILLAFVDALLLGFSVLLLIMFLSSKSKLASLLLLPYFVWVMFASYLNWSIYMIN